MNRPSRPARSIAGAAVLGVALLMVSAGCGTAPDDSVQSGAAASVSPGESATSVPAPLAAEVALTEVTDLVVSADGRYVYTANTNETEAVDDRGRPSRIPKPVRNTVSVFDTERGAVSAIIAVPGEPKVLTLTRDGEFLHVLSDDAVAVVATESNTVVRHSVADHGSIDDEMALGPDNSRLYVIDSLRQRLSVRDARTAGLITTTRIPDIEYLLPAPDGRTAYLATDEKAISVVDTGSLTVTATIPLESDPGRMASTPDGRLLHTTRGQVIDTATNTVIAESEVGTDIASSPNGKYFFVAGRGKRGRAGIQVVDAHTRSLVDTLPIVTLPGMPFPETIAISPDGRRVYAAGPGTRVMWIFDTGRYA